MTTPSIESSTEHETAIAQTALDYFEGWFEGDAVVCPWHGFDFVLGTGHCRVDEDLSIAVYPVRVTGDSVEVDLP